MKSLPFFRADLAPRPPLPYRLWSPKLLHPLLACAVAPFQCLWVHYDPSLGRTVMHDPRDCLHCQEGRPAQYRGYAPAFIRTAEGWNGMGRAPEPATWTRGVLELPSDSLPGIEPCWPMVWLLERLDKTNGRVRNSLVKGTNEPLPEFHENWPIEPTIRRVYGLRLVKEVRS